MTKFPPISRALPQQHRHHPTSPPALTTTAPANFTGKGRCRRTLFGSFWKSLRKKTSCSAKMTATLVQQAGAVTALFSVNPLSIVNNYHHRSAGQRALEREASSRRVTRRPPCRGLPRELAVGTHQCLFRGRSASPSAQRGAIPAQV